MSFAWTHGGRKLGLPPGGKELPLVPTPRGRGARVTLGFCVWASEGQKRTRDESLKGIPLVVPLKIIQDPLRRPSPQRLGSPSPALNLSLLPPALPHPFFRPSPGDAAPVTRPAGLATPRLAIQGAEIGHQVPIGAQPGELREAPELRSLPGMVFGSAASEKKRRTRSPFFCELGGVC